MNKDVTYYLSVRLSQAVSGWMHGRLADPLITLDEIPSASGAVAMSISGRPVSVPSIVIFKKYADLPVSLQEKYRATGGGSGGASGGGSDNVDANDPLQRNRRSNPRPSGSDGIAELEAWLPVVNDTAIADPTSWTIRTLGANNLGAAAQCVTEKNKVAGIVTTNATQYKAGAPVYDTATKSLNYTVSAPHYMSSGEVFKGAYSLIIRSDIARCIYKFTSAPITATIEVVETETGASTVVTNVSENNGWMKLTATGFTHSTPTIRVAFSQSASQPSSGSAARIDVAKGKSISSTVLVRKAGLKATARSRIWLSVAAASRRVCRLSGKTVKAVALGTCSVTVSVQTSGKTLKRALQLNVG